MTSVVLPTLALGAAAPGLLAVLAPGLGALPWALPPLHGRCVGVMQLALLLALWRGGRSHDPALAHGPLRALVVSCAGSVAALLALALAQHGLSPLVLAWLTAYVLLGGAAELSMRAAHELQAPAEHPDRAWLLAAALTGTLALALLTMPSLLAPLWPWRMSPPLAAAYVGPFAALASLAFSIARERRAYVRRALLLPLLSLPLAVLVVSLWHHQAFGAAGSTVLWFGAFGALAALAAQRLATAARPVSSA